MNPINKNKNKYMMTFTRVDYKLGSIKNSIKNFLLVFSEQIEKKNLYVNIKQGSLPPDVEIHTDWKNYFMILY